MKGFLKASRSAIHLELHVLKLLFRSLCRGNLFYALSLLLREHIKFLTNLYHFLARDLDSYASLKGEAWEKLSQRAQALHPYLQHKKAHFFSILVPVFNPKSEYLEKALLSALNQSAPEFEVLVGLDGPQNKGVMQSLERVKSIHPKAQSHLRIFSLPKGGISQSTNALAKEARGDFLIFLDHDDWLRPDLLLRYHQELLRAASSRTVVYCDEYKINEKDQKIPSTDFDKIFEPQFPYFFINSICHCLGLPKKLWEEVGAYRSECDGAQDYDLCLRLSEKEADFKRVPVPLYAWRAHRSSTARGAGAKDYASQAGLKALKDYVERQNLNWDVSLGLAPTQYRARPKNKDLQVQVIIPYRDQEELTLRAVDSVSRQKNVPVKITCVDNQSQNKALAEKLRAKGVEVLSYDRGFNFSAINNFAVENSRYKNDIQAILFLNNDVELKDNALEEMLCWLGEKDVGLVGARLLYPNGRLQHGGLIQDEKGPARNLNFVHLELGAKTEEQTFSKVIYSPQALTGACLLVRKKDFESVGGFDELYFANTYSDVDLCLKFKSQLNLRCLYTPYAEGIHFESVSRGRSSIEDYEFLASKLS